MSYSLAEAAKATGTNKTTILRAIKSGKVSGTRDEQGAWRIEPAEVHRVYAPVTRSDAGGYAAQHDAITDILVAELRATIADLRSDRDAWRCAHEKAQQALAAVTLRLPPPDAPAIALPMAQDAAVMVQSIEQTAPPDAVPVAQDATPIEQPAPPKKRWWRRA